MVLSNIKKFRTRKRVPMCYPWADTDFIKYRLEVTHGSRKIIIHAGGNSIRNMNGMFQRSEILLKKYKELLIKGKEIGKIRFL